MGIRRKIGCWLVLGGLLFHGIGDAGQKTHTVYFEGEHNELHVYRIFGSRPGKTLLIIGGIQGDEPGGFLAADFYVDMSLEKGNLIVVPRANFPSILKKERQINQDMNRKFMDDHTSNYEAEVVDVLKELICQSDCFLNLHEGSGFYSRDWKSEDRNPEKFGQSVIADDAFLVSDKERGGQGVDLEKMALAAIKKINQGIDDAANYFHFNNHRTGHADSMHKEQRRSATYYAMNVCKIPAFGIESAKSLPLEQKVRQHILGVEGFMSLLGIVPKSPGIDLRKPEMQYMIISVNNSIPVVVEKMQRLKVRLGDVIQVHDVVANYERGLSVDVIGVGNEFNDMKKKLQINESTRIEAKKDFYACGSIFLDIEAESAGNPAGNPAGKLTGHIALSNSKKSDLIRYKLKVNGAIRVVENYARVNLRYGDRLTIVDIITGDVDPSEYIVNFKGFVGSSSKNTGEDRGYVIDTGAGVLMPRYSQGNKGRQYQVLTTLDGKEVGKLYIDIQS